MKYFSFTILALFIGAMSWMGIVREPLPAIPEIVRPLSDEVPFDFAIKSMNATSVELELQNKVKGKELIARFSMNNAFKTGRAGLVLNSIGGRSTLSGGMSARKYLENSKRKKEKTKDFSDFMKDRSGRSVQAYKFKQVLEEGRNGETFILIAYHGPTMNMLQTLEIPRPITLPKHISQMFTEKGIIQFKPGKVAFDSRAKGFHIPVVIR